VKSSRDPELALGRRLCALRRMRRHAPPKAVPARTETRDHQSSSLVSQFYFLGAWARGGAEGARGVAGKLAVLGVFSARLTTRGKRANSRRFARPWRTRALCRK